LRNGVYYSFILKLEGVSTNDLGHGPWGVFQKALKIMDHRKTQAGQEKTIFPLATSEIQGRAFKVFSLQERGEGLYKIAPTCK